MFRNNELQFFQSKIYDLGTAVFHNESLSVLKIPNRVISVLHVDEVGQLWFFVKRPTQNLSEFEQTFYGSLDFVRKGKDFFVKVEGKASLVIDPEEINELDEFSESVKEKARNEEVLVKMKLSNIMYFEKAKRQRNNWFELINNYFYNLIFTKRPAYRLLRLQPEPGF